MIKVEIFKTPLTFMVISFVAVLLCTGFQLYRGNLNIKTQIIGDQGDNYQFYSFIHYAKQNIVSFKHPFGRTNLIRYPVGFNFMSSSDGSLFILLGVLFSFFVPLTVAYNITVLFVLFLNMFLSMISFKAFCSLLGKKCSLGSLTLASVTFALSPYVISKTGGHMNLLFVGGFPLFLFASTNIIKKLFSDKLSIYDYCYLYLSILLIGMGSLQYLASLSLVIFVCLIVIMFTNGFAKTVALLSKGVLMFCFNNVPSFLFTTQVFLICTVYLWAGYLKSLIGDSNLRLFGTSQQWRDLIIPNQYLGKFWVLFNTSPSSIESVATVGIAALVGFIFVVVIEKRLKHKLIYMYVFGLILLFSSQLINTPLVSQSSRFVVYGSLFVAVLFLLSPYLSKKLVYFLLLLTFVERILFSIYISAPFPTYFFKTIDTQPGSVVLTVPVYNVYGQFKNLIPVFTNKKIVEGYMHYVAESGSSRIFLQSFPISSFSCASGSGISSSDPDSARLALLAELVKLDIQTIVIFKDILDIPECTEVKALWVSLLELKDNDGNHYLFKTLSGRSADVYLINLSP